MPLTSNTACYQPPRACEPPGALPTNLTISISQVIGPGVIGPGITLDSSQILGMIPLTSLEPDVLTAALGPVSGMGPNATRDLILTLNGSDTTIPLTALTSGVGGKTLVGFIFSAI